MLERAQERALAVRAAHGLSGLIRDDVLRKLLVIEGLEVIERCPFRGRTREIYFAGKLGLRAGLEPGWARWLKCHGLGHHLLHRGNHLYVRDGLYLWQQHEIEAELFAGTLLFPKELRGRVGLSDIAAAAGVPIECVQSWQTAALLAEEVRRQP